MRRTQFCCGTARVERGSRSTNKFPQRTMKTTKFVRQEGFSVYQNGTREGPDLPALTAGSTRLCHHRSCGQSLHTADTAIGSPFSSNEGKRCKDKATYNGCGRLRGCLRAFLLQRAAATLRSSSIFKDLKLSINSSFPPCMIQSGVDALFHLPLKELVAEQSWKTRPKMSHLMEFFDLIYVIVQKPLTVQHPKDTEPQTTANLYIELELGWVHEQSYLDLPWEDTKPLQGRDKKHVLPEGCQLPMHQGEGTCKHSPTST
eukprot:6491265-Amphidinium_carterae.1